MPTETDPAGKSQWIYVPADCLRLLPFASEALNRWRPGNDLSRFLERLNSEEIHLSNDFTTLNAPEHFLKLADELSASSVQTYHERIKRRPARINYRSDPTLGGFAKAWAAWQAVETELLSENGSFSLAHTLETTTDMECALDLAKRFYYRQATICLRTFIEDLIYPLYFLHHRPEFDQWKAGTSRLPRMRGRDGMLDRLVKRNALDAAVANRLATAYQDQNRAVHGAAGTLINSGTFTREWQGHHFKPTELAHWLEMAKECLECGLFVVKRVSDDWLESTRNIGHFCRRCHGRDYRARKYRYRTWGPVEIDLGGIKFTLPKPEGPRPEMYVFTCRRCGEVWHGTRPDKAQTSRPKKTSAPPSP